MKRTIVIASTLKPVDDVRTYWKFAQSMIKTNKGKYDVNIIGNEGKKDSAYEDIHFHTHRVLRNQMLKRVLITCQVFVKIWKLKPHILIITTHELLFASFVLKLMRKCHLIYDIQENYALNATLKKHTLGWLLSVWIAEKEKYFSRFVDHFILAESCYKDQLHFLDKRFTIIENKAIEQPTKTKKQTNELRILFSGTISQYSGALSAMQIMIHLTKENPGAKALLIGQIHDKKLHEELKRMIKAEERIELRASQKPVAYEEILSAIRWASLGIIAYQPNEINKNKIPTKLYEYTRYRLPYLVQRDTLWSGVGAKLGGAIPVELENPDLSLAAKTRERSNHLFPKSYPKVDTWEFESQKLIKIMDVFLECQ